MTAPSSIAVRRYMREIGRRRSDAKTAAARANGAKGGRPQLPCVTGTTPEGHRRGVCAECRRAAALAKRP